MKPPLLLLLISFLVFVQSFDLNWFVSAWFFFNSATIVPSSGRSNVENEAEK